MNSSNSFNICPRCGNANALNAKYCSRCGGQLKVPEEPVVCHRCHARNTPMANFCRNCGAELKVGSETKICPKCGKEVDANENVCVCGYSFVTLQQTLPATSAVNTPETNDAPIAPAPSKKLYNTKGGRGWAIAAVVLILLFAYYVLAPFVVLNRETSEVAVTLRPEFLVNLDKGFVNGEGLLGAYGYDFVHDLVVNVISVIKGEAEIGAVVGSMGPANIMILSLTLIFVVAMLAHIIVAFVRCFTAKRSKHMNWIFLVLAALSTLVVGLITLFYYVSMPEGFMQTIASWFALPEGTNLGFAIWAIPLYFWFFFLYSLCAKAKKLKENA